MQSKKNFIFLNFRLKFSLSSVSAQHFMIASEKEYIQCKMPKNVIKNLRQIKEVSLVISPDQIVSQVIFYLIDLIIVFEVFILIVEGTKRSRFVRPKSIQFTIYR